jgi:hypothetical protein
MVNQIWMVVYLCRNCRENVNIRLDSQLDLEIQMRSAWKGEVTGVQAAPKNFDPTHSFGEILRGRMKIVYAGQKIN